ncbi:MAG: hypothetical protein ACRC4N_07565 [Gammaproteobacteria bacterium]
MKEKGSERKDKQLPHVLFGKRFPLSLSLSLSLFFHRLETTRHHSLI